MTRLRLDIAYDGTDFSGWAAQPGRRTVAGVLLETLRTVLRVPDLRVTVAGRTDAGVHASGQVAHTDVPDEVWAADGDRLHRRLARMLPADVRVRAVAPVADEFDARFGALWRRYEYRICDSATGADPLRRRFVASWPRPLDVGSMQSAATRLVGLHDFAAFCRRREGGTTIRTLQALDVRRAGDEIVATVQADAFCHSMVRSLMGALIAVGEGRRGPEWPAELLGLDVRANGITVAPAHGLTLVHVEYPAEEDLAARAEQTRALR